jgi:AcrR family transcriptional regulator
MQKTTETSKKRATTRARLVEAAVDVIREKGFYATTLDAVARRAGMTRGAIYGNFKDKDELFLAVIETRWRPIFPQKTGVTLKEHMRLVAEAVIGAIPARRAQAVGAFSFQLYALTHDDTRARIAQLNADWYRQAGERLEQLVGSGELPMAGGELARVIHALTDGLLLLRCLQPDLITDHLIVKAFEALA